MGAPVVRWTPGEAWLMAELGRRALVARLDGGGALRAAEGEGAAFRVEVHAGELEVELVMWIDAERAEVALVPERVSGHGWREGWMLVAVRGEARWTLAPGGPPIEIAGARAAPVRVELAVQRRVLFGVLGRAGGAGGAEIAADAREPVPIADAALHRYTRQSTATELAVPAGALPPWMAPTEAEPAPWWELDLGRTVCAVRIAVALAAPAPPAGTRVVCRAFGFGRPSGEMWPDSAVLDAKVEALAGARFELELRAVARYVRVELIAPPGERVVLAIASCEVLAAELYADTLLGSMRRAFALFAERPLCLARGEDGAYVPALSYAEVWDRAMALARRLALGAERPGERLVLGVMLRNRPAWLFAEIAALARGYLVVAMSPDDADDRLAEVIARAAPGCVICEDDDATRLARLAPGARVIAVSELEGAAGASDEEVPPAQPRSEDDPYAVLFTSGSTGAPKGAVRTYRTFHTMIQSYAVGHSPRHLSFQPLSHLSERMYQPALLLHGGALGFSRGGSHLLEELRALEPTTIGSVPRLYEVLHAAHERRVRAAGARTGAAGARAEVVRRAVEAASLLEARRAFGGRLMAVSVGSAPVGPEVLAFMRRCFADLWVSEGYGSTEVGSIAFDGVVLPHVEVKLVARPDAAPPAPGAPERGEIYVRTPHTIAGYLGDPAATAAAIDPDGFFATGDLGERGADGRVRVIGRVRNTVKLAQGEFLSIERVEVALGSAELADRVFVHVAHGAASFAALVVPHAEALARALGLSPGGGAAPLAELIARPGAAEAVLSALRAHGREARLAAYELPRAVLLEAAPLTVEAGLLTASGKLARGALAAKYGAALAALAAGDGAEAEAAAAPAAETAAPPRTLLERIARAAGGVIGRAIDPREPLGTGVGVDSLTAAEILEAISGELGREVPLAWWFEAGSLADLAARLETTAPGAAGDGPNLSGAGAATAAALAIADLALEPRLGTLPAVRPLRTVLLTGATGFLGAHLAESLRARGVEVVCLVRAAGQAEAEERLARRGIIDSAHGAYKAAPIRASAGDSAHGDLARGASKVAPIRALAGDLAAPGLGLGEPAAHPALASLDAIVHAGAAVSWLASYAALRGPNVLGTLALLELAAARGIPLHHISTISTAPPDGDEDSRLDLTAALAATPYALSKWVAEEHVRRAAAAGVPVAVYRPAMIAPHTARGTGNPDDFLCRYLAGCLDLGLYIADEAAVIDMTPVDFVADAIAALVVAHPRGGGTHHLANADQSLTYAALGRAMAEAGARVRPAPYAEFRAALLADRASRLHALAAFFPERFSLGMGPFPCRRTAEALAALGVARPRIDGALVARYLAALAASGAALAAPGAALAAPGAAVDGEPRA